MRSLGRSPLSWRSIDESPARRPPKRFACPVDAPPGDRSTRLLETTAICLTSLLAHALLGFVLVMLYLEVHVEPEQTYSVTIWREARGKDVLRIGAPEEGTPKKAPDLSEPPKRENPPKVEEPKAPPPPDPIPAPAPLPPAPPPPAPVLAEKPPAPVPPPPKETPEGGAKEEQPAAPTIGAGASSGSIVSDKPGAAKPGPSSGGDVTEADIDRNPTAAIRRRRAGTLVKLREGSQRDIVVVAGAYDQIQAVLDTLEIPYLMIDPEELPRHDLSRCKALLINCHSGYSAGMFHVTDLTALMKEIVVLEEREAALRTRVQESKEKKKVFELGLELLKASSQLSSLRQQLEVASGAGVLVENIRKFVDSGGYLFTSDWGLSILERAFPGTVKNGGNIGPRMVTLKPHFNAKSPLLDEVFYSGPKTGTVTAKKLLWEVDSGSYVIKVEKTSVEVLVEAGDLQRNPAVAVTFVPDRAKGRVLHILSHFERQATKHGDYALQNLLLNFLMERIKAE